jgi:Zn-finger nucleic acid-binding protein
MPKYDLCPLCGANLVYEVEGKTYSRCIGVEIQGVYDGMLFYQCPDCDGRWHRFPEGDPLHERARKYVDRVDVALRREEA